MAELLAIGPDIDHRWQKELPVGKAIRIGRAPGSGWSVPWDRKISREHADLTYRDNRLEVETLGTARNATRYRGESCAVFKMSAGEYFEIGDTTFKLVDASLSSESSFSGTGIDHGSIVERAFSRGQLSGVKFDQTEIRIEVLCQLPQLVSSSSDNEDFATRIVDLLLQTIPRCNAAAVVQFETDSNGELTDPEQNPDILRWNGRPDVVRFSPSRRLMRSAIQRRESIVHFWCEEEGSGQYTVSGNLDWAFCTPMLGEMCHGWCLYVSGKIQLTPGSGKLVSEDDLKPDIRFAEVMAEFISAVRDVRMLQQQQTEMTQFFSPAVVETLTNSNAKDSLIPRIGDVSVLFCDVRGFSKMVEKSADDLFNLLFCVSEALGVMTRNIRRFEGVIADFQGDAALAFWGWPSPVSDGPLLACRTALAIHRGFAEANKDPENLLYGFRIGMGVGCGKAIAGKIGSEDQTKVGVFGPIVNLTARLESMTKHVGVTILLDEPTASYVRAELPASEGRLRPVARVRPSGIETPVLITQLFPSEIEHPALTDRDIETYAAALEAMNQGTWKEAEELLQRVPLDDGPRNFLTRIMQDHDFNAPSDWDAVIELDEK